MSSVPSGRSVVGADSGGELYDSAELPRHLPAAGQQATSIWRTERAAEVPSGPWAHCVSNPARFPGWLGNQSPVTGLLNTMQAVTEAASF